MGWRGGGGTPIRRNTEASYCTTAGRGGAGGDSSPAGNTRVFPA